VFTGTSASFSAGVVYSSSSVTGGTLYTITGAGSSDTVTIS
jgi:hypothetical protein